MKRLVNTIYLENSELYTISNGRRIKLADCSARVEIYEHSEQIRTVGNLMCNVKKRHIKIVLCGEFNFTRAVDSDYIKTVTAFEICGDLQREDGIFERKCINGLIPLEIDLDGEWMFEITEAKDWNQYF